VRLENLKEMSMMTLDGESLREQKLEKENHSFEWQADILEYEGITEVEMLYIFDDPEDEIFDQVTGLESVYECEMTEDRYHPTIDSLGDKTMIFSYMPIEQSLDHEIAQFPSQYLEELRDQFYDQVIR